MLDKPTIEELLPRVENRYTLAVTVAKRARQLVDGGKALVATAEGEQSLLTIACEELAEDRFVPVPGKHEPHVPLRLDVLERLANQVREQDDDLEMKTQFSPLQEETSEPEAPVSKIRIMQPDEMFYMPYEVDELEEDAETETEDEEDIDMEAETLDPDEADTPRGRGPVIEEEEEIELDDLDKIDASIDLEPEEEDEDL